jgi:adenylate cyclase
METFFHSFWARLTAVLFLLLLTAQGTAYLMISVAADRSAQEQVEEKISEAIETLQKQMDRRVSELRLATKLLSKDYAFATAFSKLQNSKENRDRETLRSMLQNYEGRIGSASFLVLISLEGEKLAETLPEKSPGFFLDPKLLHAAEESPDLEATGVTRIGESLHFVVLRPLLMPNPRAWIAIGFPLNRALAEELGQLTHLEIAFEEKGRIAASTPALTSSGWFSSSLIQPHLQKVSIGGRTFFGRATAFPGDVVGGTEIVMLRSLEAELAPFRNLKKQLLIVSMAALGVSLACAVLMARQVTSPVQILTRGVERIERGDYQVRVPAVGRDELSRLGSSFNRMAEGLDERDRVRALLGKTVSPEIAHELLNSGLELGGEVREASILFSDLRGFTAYSETQSPAELVAQLNEYFTEVGSAVEAEGGVIDKFIGDAIMAVFGAPTSVVDHADRAIKAARGVLKAEHLLNQRRAERGQPPLKTGVGISTGWVVAGAIGSPSRCNYTVIGDAVNLASRIESLTKDPSFDARIICSDSTRAGLKGDHSLRDLGETVIRGKERPIRLWAVDFDPSVSV